MASEGAYGSDNDKWNDTEVLTGSINTRNYESVLVQSQGFKTDQSSPSSSSGRNTPTPPTSNTSFVTSEVVVNIAGPYKYLPGREMPNGRPYSRTNLQACSYESHVDITDTDAVTTVSLHLCQNSVVSRYNTLLKLIGWKPFGADYSFRHPRIWKGLNYIYTLVVILLLLYSYVYSALFCENQLHVRKVEPGQAKLRVINITNFESTKMTTIATTAVFIKGWEDPSEPMFIGSTGAVNKSGHNNSLTTECNDNHTTVHEYHLITTYIVPSIIHFFIYIYGFIHFRVQENEHLDALMERVFLQAQTTFGFQEKLIRNTRRYLWLAAGWVLLNMFLYGLGLAAYGLTQSTIESHCPIPKWASILLAALYGVSQLLTSCVCVAVVLNYASQCEFLLFSIHHICLQLHERQFDLKQAMHEILGVRDQLSQLNGALAKITSLCVLNFGAMFVIGFALLIMNTALNAEQWVCRTVFLFCWFSILLVPLIQAARMTKMGEKLRQISFEIRVFGYKSCSQLDLDSFILFVSNATLRTKLFSVPVKPAYLVSTAAIIMFTLLLLFQTDAIETKIPNIL